MDAQGAGSELISSGDNMFLRIRADDIEAAKRVPNGPGGTHARCLGVVPGHLDGRWHHVALVIDATSATIYFDGAQNASS